MMLLMFVAGLALGDNPQIMDGGETWSAILIGVSVLWLAVWLIVLCIKALENA